MLAHNTCRGKITGYVLFFFPFFLTTVSAFIVRTHLSNTIPYNQTGRNRDVASQAPQIKLIIDAGLAIVLITGFCLPVFKYKGSCIGFATRLFYSPVVRSESS